MPAYLLLTAVEVTAAQAVQNAAEGSVVDAEPADGGAGDLLLAEADVKHVFDPNRDVRDFNRRLPPGIKRFEENHLQRLASPFGIYPRRGDTFDSAGIANGLLSQYAGRDKKVRGRPKAVGASQRRT